MPPRLYPIRALPSLSMRIVGIDLGERRIGFAISDATATLARALRTIERKMSDDSAAQAVLDLVAQLNDEDEVGCLVIGLPGRLDGTPNAQTARVRQMVAILSSRSAIPIVLQDQRLSS